MRISLSSVAATTIAVLLSSTPLSPMLLAQTQVVPATLTSVEGPGSTNYPFGLGSPCRVQNWFHATETGIAGAALLRALEIRANGNSANAAKSSVDLQISISATPATLASLSTTFAQNHGANVTVVYTRKLTNVAASTPQTPGSYAGPWPFDVPFLYLPTQGNLLVDYDIAGQPSGSWTVDSPFGGGSGVHTTIGTACHGLAATSSGGGLGTRITYTVSGGQSNAPAALLLGTARFPTPVPIPGLPGCSVHVVPLLTPSLTLNASGGGALMVPVPEDAWLRGLTLYGQFGAAHTTQGLAVSASRAVMLDGYSAARIYNLSSNTSPSGSVQARSAVVVRLGV